MAPDWLDRSTYPWPARRFRTDAGWMHYVDTGDGPPVLFLHGNPTWSFLYRHLIRALAPRYRCIAPDYPGFGLSEKHPNADLSPPAQASRIEALITRLGLQDLTLVLHDWGGPIGLAYALRHPANVRRLVLMNTWGWPLDHHPLIAAGSRLAGSAVGRYLIARHNLFVRVVMPLVMRRPLSPAARRHYRAPLSTPSARRGSWIFPRALRHATPWLRRCWAHRHRLAHHPALLLWGLHDPAFGPSFLRRWQSLFSHPTVHLLDVGHYVPEEAGPTLAAPLASFLRAS